MAKLIDPALRDLMRDLAAFRKGPGEPSQERLTSLFDLTEALGEGVAERAMLALGRYYDQYGTDPESDIGAFFYMAGWGVGGHSIDQRRARYRDTFLRDISTAWRRSERGREQLAALIRDHSEYSRPWAVVSVFQTGGNFQAILDFNLGHESWQPPAVQLNDDDVTDLDLHLHTADGSDPARRGPGTRYTSHLILPEVPLNFAAASGDPLGRVRVIWDMPVWPVWQTLGWTTDPETYVRTRTFRERAVEVAVSRR